MPGFVAHYLRIEWLERGVARRIEVSVDPVELEQAEDGSYLAETQIFRDFHPWVGLRFTPPDAEVPPHIVDTRGKTRPWLRILDSEGRGWWIQDDGWDPERHVHLSELHRSFGRFEIQVGSAQLFLTNIALELGCAEAEDYLADFRDELIMLALSHTGTATGEVIRSETRDLVEALSEFAHAARQVLNSPAQELAEVEQLQPVTRLRPNARTFRDILRRPGQRAYPGRSASAIADIPDNRFMRHMVQHCAMLSSMLARASERQSRTLQARAERAKQHALELASADSEKVSPEIFDRQLAEMEGAIDAVNSWSMPESRSGREVRSFRIKLEKPFNSLPHTRFYKRSEADPSEDERLEITSSIVQLPAEAHQLVERACKVIGNHSKLFTFTGVAEVRRYQKKDSVRHLHLKEVHCMEVRSPGLENKAALRERYERNGWIRKLTRQEVEERQLEARSSERRAAQLAGRGRLSRAAAEDLCLTGEDLNGQDQAWSSLGVAAGAELPMGMRFVQSPAYASALAAFNRVQDLTTHVGIGGERLEQIERIGILHASAIFERWCLVRLISLLVDTFRFAPEPDWLDRVVEGTCAVLESFELTFNRDDVGLTARLEFQPRLANGRRPDFRLTFKHRDAASDGFDVSDIYGLDDEEPAGGLVLDAKFRTRWRAGEADSVLHNLAELRGYREAARRVFILQPAGHVISKPSSPLDWARDCDYGQNDPGAHRQGIVRISPEPATWQNLQRLVALELQASFPAPLLTDGTGWVSESFCIGCGCHHETKDIRHYFTKGGHDSWDLICGDCGLATRRTHCFSKCGTKLFKNGLMMTYHRTIADQLTNVVCPCCGEFFDRDIHSFESRDQYY